MPRFTPFFARCHILPAWFLPHVTLRGCVRAGSFTHHTLPLPLVVTAILPAVGYARLHLTFILLPVTRFTRFTVNTFVLPMVHVYLPPLYTAVYRLRLPHYTHTYARGLPASSIPSWITAVLVLPRHGYDACTTPRLLVGWFAFVIPVLLPPRFYTALPLRFCSAVVATARALLRVCTFAHHVARLTRTHALRGSVTRSGLRTVTFTVTVLHITTTRLVCYALWLPRTLHVGFY